MNLKVYQKLAVTTSVYPPFATNVNHKKDFILDKLFNTVLNITRLYRIRLETNLIIDRLHVKDLLGDSLWYMVVLMDLNGIELDNTDVKPIAIRGHSKQLEILRNTPTHYFMQLFGILLIKRKQVSMEQVAYLFVEEIQRYLSYQGYGKVESLYQQNLEKIEELYPSKYRQ